MADRKKALDEKKRRLEELKARRAQRGTQTVSATEQAKARIEAASNLDEYIDGLLRAPTANGTEVGAGAMASPTLPAQAVGGREVQTASSQGDKASTISSPAPAPSPAKPVIKTETFEMGTQVTDEDFPPPSEDDEEEEQPQAEEFNEKSDAIVGEVTAATAEELKVDEEAKFLSAEEVEKELASDTFSSFLNQASKKVERVLGSAVLADLLADYDGETDGAERSAKISDGSNFISSRQIYECPKWTATRDVTDMDWSPLHRELMLCSYHMPSSTSKLAEPKGSTAVKVISPDDTPSDSLAPRSTELQSDGLALIWNLSMPNRPEHVFTCGSPVTTTRFHPSESSLIIGGCQSGQVVVWDVRAGRMPVQKSSLTTTSSGNSKGHTHPICAMEVIEAGVSWR
jgi:dynein intermediate chain, cytosolic